MAYDAEKISALTDRELTILAGNVSRLAAAGSKAQMAEASRLSPLIEHERSTRQANKPPSARKGVARKTKTKIAD